MLTVTPMPLAGPGPVTFMGLGMSEPELDAAATELARSSTVYDIRNALQILTPADRQRLAEKIIALNPAKAGDVNSAMNMLPVTGKIGPNLGKYAVVWGVLGTASMAASAYHGYKRNRSIGWALVWGFFGALAPVITPVIAVAQGFAKPK